MRVNYTRASVDMLQEHEDDFEVRTPMKEHREVREVPESSECGQSIGVASESDCGDSEDVFEPTLPSPLDQERGRGSFRVGRGSFHRKWSRSRKASGGDNSKRRDSAVTDKAILSHFASRRHSTFFI